MSDIHVLPTNDILEHQESADCWCYPVVEAHGANLVIIHNSFDGRECGRGEAMFANCECGLTVGCDKCRPAFYTYSNYSQPTVSMVSIDSEELAWLRRIAIAAERLCLEHGTYKVLFDDLRKAVRR